MTGFESIEYEVERGRARITLNLTNIPFTEALRYVGSLAGVAFTYDKYAIMVKPVGGFGQGAV